MKQLYHTITIWLMGWCLNTSTTWLPKFLPNKPRSHGGAQDSPSCCWPTGTICSAAKRSWGTQRCDHCRHRSWHGSRGLLEVEQQDQGRRSLGNHHQSCFLVISGGFIGVVHWT
jgi:hypothetical protein